ncbi:MAG: ABC transporter permease [FCB group bacterium]|nr:ABC transporter permease [FCB group bacterium]
MVTLKLAYKNIIGAGLRTWLNVVVLSFSFVLIIWTQGLYKGMNQQASRAMKEMELGGGQFWHPEYDPYDPLTLEDSHGPIPEELQVLIDKGEAVPILITSATIYPDGRFQTVQLKGILPEQSILGLPTGSLRNGQELPVLIGTRMAKSANLDIGDYFTIRWRDARGVFDAIDGKVVNIFRTTVGAVDRGQIWVPIDRLREMLGMPGEGTIVVIGKDTVVPEKAGDWVFRNLDYLLREIAEVIRTKKVGASIMYALLLSMALLAIFDTQVLSLFRRRKEMGTLMALGMTRGMLIRIFTLEGAFHGILAVLVGAVYGVPLLIWFEKNGWPLPDYADDFGMALGNTLYPIYGAWLVIGTTLLILLAVTIVSFLPTRRIAKLKPTDALRGKIS